MNKLTKDEFINKYKKYLEQKEIEHKKAFDKELDSYIKMYAKRRYGNINR